MLFIPIHKLTHSFSTTIQILGQRWSVPIVTILGKFWEKLFLVNLYIGIMKISGDQAFAGAFGQELLYFPDHNDKKTQFF